MTVIVGALAAYADDGATASSDISARPTTPDRRPSADDRAMSAIVGTPTTRQQGRTSRRSADFVEYLRETRGRRIVDPDRLIRWKQPAGDGAIHHPHHDRRVAHRREHLVERGVGN